MAGLYTAHPYFHAAGCPKPRPPTPWIRAGRQAGGSVIRRLLSAPAAALLLPLLLAQHQARLRLPLASANQGGHLASRHGSPPVDLPTIFFTSDPWATTFLLPYTPVIRVRLGLGSWSGLG